MKHLSLITLLFLILNSHSSQGQNFRYRKNEYKWPEGTPAKITLDTAFKNEDVVILDEETNMFIQEGKFRDNLNNIYVHKHFRMKFNTIRGVQKFKTVVLPESQYPQGDYIYVAANDRDSIHRPKGDYECMDIFAARIIKPNGTIVAAEYSDSISTEQFYFNLKTYSFYAFHFNVKNLQPGDELEVNYGCKQIYTNNIFFFHGVLPKQHTKYTLEYDSKFYKYYIIEHNGAKSETQQTEKGAYNEKASWEYNNLPACMDEPGSRPYLELPYVTFYRHDLNYGIWNDARTIIQSYLPYTWDYINLAYIGYQPQDVNDYLSKTDKATISIRNLYNSATSTLADTTPLSRFTAIHNHIAQNFNYQQDDAYYGGTDFRLPRIDEFLDNHTLRQISRMVIYNKLFERMRCDYYTTFLFDKRVNSLNFDRYEESVAHDKYFSLIQNESANYFHPKVHRFGWFANEMPFYFEDTKCILIPQAVPYEQSYSDIKTVKYSYLKTPYSSITDNSRNSNVLANISLDSLNANFQATIKLSGQFSTMNRGTYLYDFVDTTSSFQYGEKICDHIKGVAKPKISITGIDSVFPFKADFVVEYKSSKLVERLPNNTYKINLESWFKHIYDPTVTSANRTLAYYPDYVCQDRYKYFIKFDSKVKLVQIPDSAEYLSDYDVYKFKVTQIQPDVILIESALVIKSDVVPPADVKHIENVYQAIDTRNKSFLVVERQSE